MEDSPIRVTGWKERLWSGSHRGPFDPRKNVGIFLATGPVVKKETQIERAEIIDVAPTILHILGIDIPVDIDGKVLDILE